MSCPYTSPQNGKPERIIRSINNVIRSLLFQASMPPSYWVEALSTATSLINVLPTKTLGFSTPHLALLGTPPAYAHLRVFGCKCYPNLSATASHKLTPRSTLCFFLGYSAHHKGYRCLDMSSNQIIISRHVIFDETAFPFTERDGPSTPATLEFLDASDTVLAPIRSPHNFLPVGPSSGASTCAPSSRVATPSSSPAPRAATAPTSSTERYVPPGLRGRPTGLPPGSPPPKHIITKVYSRRPRSTTAPALAPLPTGTVAVPPVVNQHPMATQGKHGFRVPVLFIATSLSPVLKTYRGGLADPAWRSAMLEEYDALLQNHTWDLVPRPCQANVVTGKWIFKHKFSADGTLERYKTL
jgi:hypothetical protein